MRLVGAGFPVFAFVPDDAGFDSSIEMLRHLEELGPPIVAMSSRGTPGLSIRVPSTGCGLIDPLVALLPYYRLIEAVTRARGLDPDRPANLNKVTRTM